MFKLCVFFCSQSVRHRETIRPGSDVVGIFDLFDHGDGDDALPHFNVNKNKQSFSFQKGQSVTEYRYRPACDVTGPIRLPIRSGQTRCYVAYIDTAYNSSFLFKIIHVPVDNSWTSLTR